MEPSALHQHIFKAFCLALIVALTFSEVALHPLIIIDDSAYVTGNLVVRSGLNSHSLQWAFTTLFYGNYAPLTWLSHMLDVTLFGLWAGGHHLTSLLLHVCSTVMLFYFFAQTTKQAGLSFMIALCFAIHPLQVEPVVWIASRKDVLSGFLFALALLSYQRYVTQPSLSRYSLVFLLFISGLLAKSVLVSLPIVLLLLDYWPLNRFSLTLKANAAMRRCIFEKLPFAVISCGAVWVTLSAQTISGSVDDSEMGSFQDRFLNVWARYFWYLGKIFVPSPVGFPYPLFSWGPSLQFPALLAIIAISICAITYARRLPYFFVGWFWFLAVLAPYTQFVQIGKQEVADRWMYLPMIGIAVAVFGAGSAFISRFQLSLQIVRIAALGIASVLVTLTIPQVALWGDERTLLSHAIDSMPQNSMAHVYRGQLYRIEGYFPEALSDYLKARERLPSNMVFGKISDIFKRLEREKELVDYLETSPDLSSVFALRERGLKLATIARSSDANQEYRNRFGEDAWRESERLLERAHSIDPSNTNITNLARTKIGLKDLKAGLSSLLKVLADEPLNADINNDIGLVYYKLEKPDDALRYFVRSVELNPTQEGVITNIGNTLLLKQRYSEALAQGDRALSISPDYGPAQLLRGEALLRLGRAKDAGEAYALAFKEDSSSLEALNGRGAALFMQGDLTGALEIFSLCIAKYPKIADLYENRAAILQKLGQEAAAQRDLEMVRTLNVP